MASHYELVIPNVDIPFKMFEFEGKDGHYKRENHWHRSVEIVAIFEGQLEIIRKEGVVLLSSGSFAIINSNEIHAISAPTANKTAVIQIPLQAFEAYFTGEQFIRFAHNTHEKDQNLMASIQDMYQAYEQKELGYEFLVKSQFFAIIYLLITQYREVNVDEASLRLNNKMRHLSKITDYIKAHYQSELSLEQLAQHFGYAPTYLSRMFQRYGGINYKSFLLSIRVEYAYQELVNSQHQIADIAANHGFPNSKSFAAAFRKRYGMLPSEYRKEKEQETTIDR